MGIFSKNFIEENLNEENNDTITTGNNIPEPSHILTPEEVLNSNKNKPTFSNTHSALDSLKRRMQHIEETDKAPAVEKEEKAEKDEKVSTLLEKCKPFITDEHGKDASIPETPLYKLESVAEILKTDTQKTIDRLAQKYDISVDYLGKFVEEKSKETVEVEETIDTTEEIKINAVFENVQSSVPFSVSDVTTVFPIAKPSDNIENTGTITFTPISDSGEEKPKIVVSSNTLSIDLTGEIGTIEDAANTEVQETVTLEKDEFEDFIPKNEIKNETDFRKVLRKFSISKRRSFITVSFSVILTLVLAFMKLPLMTGLVLGQTKTTMIVCTAILGLIVLLNFDMFISLGKIFSKLRNADICPALASLCVMAYAILGIFANEITLDILLLLAIILSVRALGKFRKDSYMLSNLKQISTPKNALKLIDDTAVTFAMAKNSIEGDTLIAAPQKCDNISDFIKYSTFGTFLNGKLPIITALSLILSLLSGFAAANYFGGAVYGLYAAAAILCFASMPNLFFIKDFPLYATAKKLNKQGSMIAGQTGAQHIEMANAVLLNSSDVFPTGTVTLHQVKVLSENSLDETILRAASLTKSLNSPLAPIFKRIAGESNITVLPDSDTVKYEERMGISGWVDDKRLYIGNRTLMEAHGIAVPNVEIDYKILRSGYFPIYVASTDKAAALLVVQYSVDPIVAQELRQLTKIGVTILVNNTDPNITDQMICDYLGLYEDSVMILSNAGYHMYKNATTPKETCSAPACFKGGNMMIAKIMNCANKIKRSNTILTILYILTAILGIMIFAYSSFAGSGTLIDSATVLLYSLICTAVSYILYLIYKP